MDADLVLAVLTDFNTNVWYELGIRHALRKGTIMVIEERQKLPFDISQYGVIKYEDSITGAHDFEAGLKSFIRKIEVEQPVDSPVFEFLRSTPYRSPATHRRGENSLSWQARKKYRVAT